MIVLLCNQIFLKNLTILCSTQFNVATIYVVRYVPAWARQGTAIIIHAAPVHHTMLAHGLS